MTEQPQTWAAADPREPAAHRIVEKIGKLEQLDPLAERAADTVGRLLGPGALKDLLSGTFLGHALHPVLTDVPIGTWTSAAILDLLGGEDSEKAADLLIGMGLAAALPTAASGWSDWADTTQSSETVRRAGLVHALANATAIGLYTASLAARVSGARGSGRLLGLAGAGVLGMGGYLGGHLAHAKGVGVNETAFEHVPSDWTATVDEAEVEEGRPVAADAGGVAVMVVRHQGRIYSVSDRCSHRGGPLHEGSVEDGCVTCPWHGSVFRLEDGSVDRGPASAPQPAHDVRVREGKVEVRARPGAPT